MSLPVHNDAELRRYTEFIIQRYLAEHSWLSIMVQALCLGICITRDDYRQVIRAYLLAVRNRKPTYDW